MRAIVLIVILLPVLAACVTETGGRTLKKSPEDAAAYNYQLGVEYLRKGKLKLARERLESSISQDASNAQAHVTLALLYQRLNEPQLADRSYRSAIRAAPDDAAVQNTYAVYLCGKKEFRDAERYFVDAAENPLYQTPAAALTNAGVCWSTKPDLDKAERYYRRALQVDQKYPDALLQLALLKLSQDNALSARAFLQRLLEAREPDAETLLLAWRVEKQLGDEQAASAFAATLTEKFPQSPQAERVKRGG